jgi:hypothetical protein
VIGVLLALAAVGPAAPVEQHGQTVFVSWDATAKACVPQVNGVETGPITSDDGKAALIAALPDKGVSLRLIGKNGYTIPYDCAADIVATLKHAGFYGRIGLGGESAPR